MRWQAAMGTAHPSYKGTQRLATDAAGGINHICYKGITLSAILFLIPKVNVIKY